MGDVQVSYQEMRDSVNKLKNAQQEMESKLGELHRMISQLTQGAFKTQSASPAFQQSYDQWNKGARQSLEGMHGMSEFLSKAIKGHEDLDQSLKSGLQQ